MRQLTVFREPESIDQPHILSFQEHAAQQPRSQFRVVHEPEPTPRPNLRTLLALRTRQQHDNRDCPACRRMTVEPVELLDGCISRNGAVIHGTPTLIGFSCNACGHEWRVD